MRKYVKEVSPRLVEQMIKNANVLGLDVYYYNEDDSQIVIIVNEFNTTGKAVSLKGVRGRDYIIFIEQPYPAYVMTMTDKKWVFDAYFKRWQDSNTVSV